MGARLAAAFAAARAQGRAALVGYLPAGFPEPGQTPALVAAMVAGGVDVVELGLPYSDPLMDGPVIAAAVGRALAAGTTTDDVLAAVAAVSGAAPVLVMSYWNPVERYGVRRFADALAAAGGAGLITPDLIPDEAGEWMDASAAAGLDRVFLAAPASSAPRLERVARASTGFVYAASTMGVTGARARVDSAARDLVARLRAVTDGPVAVGLGVSTADQAAEVAAYADGVIVGTAFVRAVAEAGSPAAAGAAVRGLAELLAAGVRRPGEGPETP